MFVENLLSLESSLDNTEVTTKAIIQDRLNKMNEAYIKELEMSGDIIKSRGQKSLLKKVGKDD